MRNIWIRSKWNHFWARRLKETNFRIQRLPSNLKMKSQIYGCSENISTNTRKWECKKIFEWVISKTFVFIWRMHKFVMFDLHESHWQLPWPTFLFVCCFHDQLLVRGETKIRVDRSRHPGMRDCEIYTFNSVIPLPVVIHKAGFNNLDP